MTSFAGGGGSRPALPPARGDDTGEHALRAAVAYRRSRADPLEGRGGARRGRADGLLDLLVRGDQRDGEALEAQIRALRLDGAVRLLGDRRGVPLVLAAADLFVFPSLSEGFGVAFLEAMAAGRPCIASDLAGVREVAGAGAAVLG